VPIATPRRVRPTLSTTRTRGPQGAGAAGMLDLQMVPTSNTQRQLQRKACLAITSASYDASGVTVKTLHLVLRRVCVRKGGGQRVKVGTIECVHAHEHSRR
jgi:hypothetical protein